MRQQPHMGGKRVLVCVASQTNHADEIKPSCWAAQNKKSIDKIFFSHLKLFEREKKTRFGFLVNSFSFALKSIDHPQRQQLFNSLFWLISITPVKILDLSVWCSSFIPHV